MKKIFTTAFAVAGLAATAVVVPAAQAAVTEIQVWAMCSEVGEVAAVKQQVEAFNAANSAKYNAVLSCKADMGKTLDSTPSSQLGDVFEFDGETLAYQVYNRKLARLDGVISKAVLANELVSIQGQGKYKDGHTYSVSQYDSGFSLIGNKKMLAAAGVTAPTTWQKAWTAAEFTKVLAKLAAKSESGKAIDIKENYGMSAGWPGYAFTPIVNSAGFQLVTNGKATGAINSPAAIKAIETFASWKKYVDPNADDAAFNTGRVALTWCGHWCTPAARKAFGDAGVVLIPFPDFGQGTKSGQGSHSWAVGAKSTGAKKAGAVAFLEFIMQDKWILNTTSQNGAVPATKTSLAKSADHKAGGLLELYGKQLSASCGVAKPTKKCVTVPRTISAAWPVINSTYSAAIGAIYAGGNAKTELTKAAKLIDQDAADNNNYN